MGKSFTSKGKTRGREDEPAKEPIEFEVDGETFVFTPPSNDGLSLRLLKIRRGQNSDAQREVLVWFGRGLNPEHEQGIDWEGHDPEIEIVEGCGACRLESRLNDPGDAFDIETLGEIVDHLIGEAFERPPTSRSASSASRKRGGRSSTGGARAAG